MLTQQQLQFLNLRASSPSAYNRHCCHPRALCLCSLFPWTHFCNQPEATTSPKLPRSFFPWLRLRLLVVFFSENDSYGHFFSAFSSSWIFFFFLLDGFEDAVCDWYIKKLGLQRLREGWFERRQNESLHVFGWEGAGCWWRRRWRFPDAWSAWTDQRIVCKCTQHV